MYLMFLQNLSLPEVLVEIEKRGSSFDEMLTIPEQDDWLYNDGKSTSCVAFILEMYKEAGLFDPIASSIQVTEFTVSPLRASNLDQDVTICKPSILDYQYMIFIKENVVYIE